MTHLKVRLTGETALSECQASICPLLRPFLILILAHARLVHLALCPEVRCDFEPVNSVGAFFAEHVRYRINVFSRRHVVQVDVDLFICSEREQSDLRAGSDIEARGYLRDCIRKVKAPAGKGLLTSGPSSISMSDMVGSN